MSEECKCIAEMDAVIEAKGYNAEILVNLFGPPRATIELCKKDDSKRSAKRPVVFASYCPFCGVHYPERENLKVSA